MKRNRILWVGIIGSLLIIQSTFWEYARMRPDFNFLVEPWSMRGTEMVHGAISVAIGVALLGALLATSTKISERPLVGAAIAVGIAAAAVVIAAVYADRELVLTFSFVVQAIVAIVGAILLYRLFGFLAGFMLGVRELSGMLALVGFLVATAIAFVIAFPVLGGVSFRVSSGVATALLMAFLLSLAVSGQPQGLNANRMMVMISVAAILALGLQAGAMRQTLVDAQALGEFGPAEYKDAQVTSGYFWAQIGALMVFVSSVSLWAKRRDHILNVQRARRQREAAEASAAEIQAALEAAGMTATQ